MSFNIGLKLWSTNIDCYFDEAKRLYKDGVFDYIELYVVPDTLQNIEKWKSIGIPFTLHAPHFMHGLNLADKNKFKFNKKIYEQVEEYRQALNTKYTIVHAGIDGDIKETIRQLKIILPINMLIENKPYLAPLDTSVYCRGARIEEIGLILNEIECGFCLDIGHAICTANSLHLEPYNYLKQFQNLKPYAYHLSGNHIDNHIDSHLHLYEGNYNYKQILSIINLENDIAIETNKGSLTNLDDFEKDIKWLKKMP